MGVDQPGVATRKTSKLRPTGFHIRTGRVLRLGGFATLMALLVIAIAGAGVLTGGARQWVYAFGHTGCIGPLEGLGGEGYRSELVTFKSRLGYSMQGWFSYGTRHPEIVIVALPGLSGNSYFALPDARIVASEGYSTFVMQHRSCVDPSLVTSGGYFESFDLMGAVDYLRSRSEIEHVGVIGFSVGGTASLLAAGQDQDIDAVVAMGGFASLEGDIMSPQTMHTPLDWIARQEVLLFLQTDLGIPVREASPVDRIGSISPRPVLLIYGELEAYNGQSLYDAAGEPKNLWIVPGLGHGGYWDAYPEEYRQRILTFFGRAFGLEEQP